MSLEVFLRIDEKEEVTRCQIRVVRHVWQNVIKLETLQRRHCLLNHLSLTVVDRYRAEELYIFPDKQQHSYFVSDNLSLNNTTALLQKLCAYYTFADPKYSHHHFSRWGKDFDFMGGGDEGR